METLDCWRAAFQSSFPGSSRRYPPLISHLHPVHGLPELVQLVGRAEGFQTDVCQLHLLVSQLISQLHDRLGFTIHALRNSRERRCYYQNSSGFISFQSTSTSGPGHHQVCSAVTMYNQIPRCFPPESHQFCYFSALFAELQQSEGLVCLSMKFQ